MIIKEATKVYRKGTKLEYILTPKPNDGEDAYYLQINDGNALNGTITYKTPEELDNIFTLTPTE